MLSSTCKLSQSAPCLLSMSSPTQNSRIEGTTSLWASCSSLATVHLLKISLQSAYCIVRCCSIEQRWVSQAAKPWRAVLRHECGKTMGKWVTWCWRVWWMWFAINAPPKYFCWRLLCFWTTSSTALLHELCFAIALLILSVSSRNCNLSPNYFCAQSFFNTAASQ